MTDVYNIDFRSWTLGGQVSPWLALKPLSQVCWLLMIYQTLKYLYGKICESQICPSGVSPNIERLCFSGNRDALLDSHLSTLGEHIDALKSPTGPWPSFDPAIIFRWSVPQLEGVGCVRLNQVDSIDHSHGESFSLIYLLSWTFEMKGGRKNACARGPLNLQVAIAFTGRNMKSLLKPWRHCRCSSLTPTHIRCYGIVPNSYLALCDCPRYYHPSDCNGNFSKLAIWQSIPLCALALDKSFRSKKSIPVFSTWTSLGYCENLPWRSWYWDSKVKFHHNSTEAMILPQILRSTSSCSPLWPDLLWASRG